MTARWLSSTSTLRAGLQLLVCVPALASCGSDSKTDTAVMTSAAITRATFTLTAPKGMSVLTPAVESATSLKLGAFAKVMPTAPVVVMGASGTTTAEPDIQLNDVWSRGPVTLKDRDKILGILHAKTLTPTNFLPAAQRDTNPVFDPVSTLTWTVTYPSTTPIDVNIDPPNKRSIDPGVYGLVTLNPVRLGGQGAELTLKTGTYYIGTLTLDSYSKVWLDQTKGPVIIYAATVNAFRGTFATVDGSPPDLFVGYLGTNPIYLETQFNGAIVAPNAQMTIRTVTGGHTGFFAAKDMVLDANATINYRAPNQIPTVAKVPQQTCGEMIQKRADLTGDAQQAAYIAELARYCGICNSLIDSDKDKTADCIDGCPYDPSKTQPGFAGCGVAEKPDEGDGVPPNIDVCGEDKRNIFPGECGCVGQANLAPAGKPCGDPACPGQTAPVCDGAGKCGSVTACRPAPDCTQVSSESDGLFVCGSTVPGGTGTPTPKTWDTAAQACKAKGLIPARIDTYAQDQLIRKLLWSYNIGLAWLGGNQIAAAGAWRWATLTSSNGDQFWSGGVTGAPVGGRFNFWSTARPAAARCLAIQAVDGRWVDADCSQPLPYVCQKPQTPRTWTIPGPGISKQTPTPLSDSQCTPLPLVGTGPTQLPDEGELSTLENQRDLAWSSSHQYTGAAANPPPANSPCKLSQAGDNCPLTSIKSPTRDGCEEECDCINTDECKAQFGAQYICLTVRDETTCVPDADAGVACAAYSRCGIPNCPTIPHAADRCSEVDFCPTEPVYTTVIDSESDLQTIPITPDSFFAPGNKPDTTPSLQYQDEPTGTGTNHSWCKLDPQATGKVKDAKQDHLNKEGRSGKNSKVQFSFKPDLIFDATPSPLAFGESNFGLHAAASLNAHAVLNNFLKLNWDKDIFTAGVGIKVSRCGVSTDETVFQILGKDFTDLVKFVKKVNTDAFTGEAKAAVTGCNVGLANFLRTADRLKKAYRDAQQLLLQYNAVKRGNMKFNANFCKDVGIEDLANELFPGAGLCPTNESPEETINRFIDFYQSDEIGEIIRLGNAVTSLNGASALFRDKVAAAFGTAVGSPAIHAPFVDFKRSETKTILKAPFFIGPVPMTIDIAVVAAYGLKGGFDLDLSLPSSLGGNRGDGSVAASPVVEQLASAKVGIEPWASAGITLFVGCDVGIASVGIEGSLTLATLSAPINAGVGIALASAPDTRGPPTDVTSVSVMDGAAPRYLLPPTAYQFYLTYDVGASVVVQDLLKGDVNGKLTIDFWLFSRTWRKRIVSFKGLPPQTFTLISQQGNTSLFAIQGGSSLSTASANSGMGRSEAQLPLTFLAYLTPPPPFTGSGDGAAGSAGAPAGLPEVAVAKDKVEKFGYDNLCCLPKDATCSDTDRLGCCEPYVCNSGTCQSKPGPACAPDGASCGWDPDLGVSITCCSGDACPLDGVCPTACLAPMAPCSADGPPCCDGYPCGGQVPGLCDGTHDPPCLMVNSACSIETGKTPCCSAESQGLPGFVHCQPNPSNPGTYKCTNWEITPG